MVEETAKGEEALVEVKEKEEEEATVADSEEEIQFSLERCTPNLYNRCHHVLRQWQYRR